MTGCVCTRSAVSAALLPPLAATSMRCDSFSWGAGTRAGASRHRLRAPTALSRSSRMLFFPPCTRGMMTLLYTDLSLSLLPTPYLATRPPIHSRARAYWPSLTSLPLSYALRLYSFISFLFIAARPCSCVFFPVRPLPCLPLCSTQRPRTRPPPLSARVPPVCTRKCATFLAAQASSCGSVCTVIEMIVDVVFVWKHLLLSLVSPLLYSLSLV
ncbi:hypothetical protein IOCL1545_000348000, partial [Leishmania shawi]